MSNVYVHNIDGKILLVNTYLVCGQGCSNRNIRSFKLSYPCKNVLLYSQGQMSCWLPLVFFQNCREVFIITCCNIDYCCFFPSMSSLKSYNVQRMQRDFKDMWAPSSEFVSSSIPSWQISTEHTQPFRGVRDLAFCLKVPLDSLLVWASSEGSGETARMRRLAWTFAAHIGDKYQIRLTRPMYPKWQSPIKAKSKWAVYARNLVECSTFSLD